MIEKFKNGYIRLIILSIGSIIVGFQMVINPDKINDWFISVLGVLWILDGISYGCDMWIKYLKKNRR